MPADAMHAFLAAKTRSLKSRARRLIALTPDAVGLRPQDLPYSPSAAHFAAANRRLTEIDNSIKERLRQLAQIPRNAPPEHRLQGMAMVEREVDRARRAFGMFFEVFAQRGTAFAPALAAHDAIAQDCYSAIRRVVPHIFGGPVLTPVTYMEHGYSPATMRRGVTLVRLLGERNPFPLIRIPWDRDQPWQATFLHEVAHNLQADLGLWEENKRAVIERLATERHSTAVIRIFGAWHKEIWADLAAVRLGGPAVAWGMAEFLSHPSDKVMTFRPGGAHPTNYFRVRILTALLERMGFRKSGARLLDVWSKLYRLDRGHRLPGGLLKEAPRAIPAVVDEIVFQPRRGLAEQALASIMPFSELDEARIRRGAQALLHRRMPEDLPPRHVVSACRYAIDAGADIAALTQRVVAGLAPVRPRMRRAPALVEIPTELIAA